MGVFSLLPVLVLGGIAFHSKTAIQERFAHVLSAKDRIITQQRMKAILDTVKIHAASGDMPQIRNDYELQTFVKKSLRVKGGGEEDLSKDTWGIPFRFQAQGVRYTLTSSGPDQRSGTEDDLQVTSNIYDF